ncbi:MAG: sigma-70 family RNA polymerase sigma factor [Christensenellaceae bacterium]|jgi:RNA polymerase sigma factor (sigma-70 family)|nr:sigma-70 family RNA polymerase sigma factor [Christensenellaceae bacterium]
MQNWQKDRNYRKYIHTDGAVACIITVDGVDVEVDAEIYAAYSRADRRERYQAEREKDKIVPLNRLEEDMTAFAEVESTEDAALRGILAGQLSEAISLLTTEEQDMLRALYAENMTEREYAKTIGLSQKGVNKRKAKALEKLKKILVLKPSGFREP